jgi:hypothetical protein
VFPYSESSFMSTPGRDLLGDFIVNPMLSGHDLRLGLEI